MKILIADDHAIVRQGLRSLLEKQGDITVVGEAEDGQAAVRLTRELSPDIVIMDITMPGLNGVEATGRIVAESPNTKVIILSVHRSRHIVREALKMGAHGYVLKSHLFDELRRAIEVVISGNRYLSPQVTDIVVQDFARDLSKGGVSVSGELTSAERELLQHLAEGLTVKQIARQLHMSPKTVDAKRRNVMNKLGITSVPDLVRYAIREGLTSVDF
ncbi:MAG: response regulator transcription factor [Sedimentisphaerales bacterium]|nr:response regulator transcription factor [Sedimentisphaerales bacterium]